jgi:hypothetical protein
MQKVCVLVVICRLDENCKELIIFHIRALKKYLNLCYKMKNAQVQNNFMVLITLSKSL